MQVSKTTGFIQCANLGVGEIHGTFVLKKKKEKKMAVKHGSHVITLLVAGVHCSVEWNFS